MFLIAFVTRASLLISFIPMMTRILIECVWKSNKDSAHWRYQNDKTCTTMLRKLPASTESASPHTLPLSCTSCSMSKLNVFATFFNCNLIALKCKQLIVMRLEKVKKDALLPKKWKHEKNNIGSVRSGFSHVRIIEGLHGQTCKSTTL